MVQTVASQEAGAPCVSSVRNDHINAFRWMVLSRLLDEKLASLYRGGKIHGGVYLGRGQEAFSVALGASLRKGDVYAPLIRDGAGRLAFGESIFDGIRTYMGSALGPMRGRDGNVHRGRPREGLLPMLSHLGAMISVVNGILFARRLKGVEMGVGGACIGEGATSTGAFHEALNQAAIEKLPLVLLVADNQYAYSTPNSRQYACRSLVDKAIGYGARGHSVDGTDLTACLKVVGEAVQRARDGEGPQLVVGRLLRLCGHGEHDDSSYIDPRLKQSAMGRDCLKVAEEYLIGQGWVDSNMVEAWKLELHHQVEEAVAIVQREAAPDPFSETWCALATARLHEIQS